MATLYYSFLKVSNPYHIFKIYVSTDCGYSWQNYGDVPTGTCPDKEWIAVDKTKGVYKGRVYFAYTEFYERNNTTDPKPIMFLNGSANLQSFSSVQNISGQHTGYLSQGVALSIGNQGDVYAAWAIYDNQSSPCPENGIGFNKSTDGGNSWLGPWRIINIQGIRTTWGHKNLSNGDIRVNSFPSMAVSGEDNVYAGTIYLVWADMFWGDPDIFLIKSTDGGSNWVGQNGINISNGGLPIRVNNDQIENGKDQFLPVISVDKYGVIVVVFYDSREDESNRKTQVWAARSTDGGNTFQNFRISDESFYLFPVRFSKDFWGDYISICSVENKSIAV